MATFTNNSTVMGINYLIFACFILLAGGMQDDEFEGSRTLGLEHSISSEAYTKRGTLVIQSLKGNKAQFTATSQLSDDDFEDLKELARNDGLYKIRVPVRGESGDGQAYVSSSTKACAILESGLQDEITLNFDQSGEVLGVSIRALVPACSGRDIPKANLTGWRTAVEVATTVSGPSPDTQSYIEKLKRDEQEKMKSNDGESKSFLGKYWMYIVPVVIMMVIMSSQDQQGGGN